MSRKRDKGFSHDYLLDTAGFLTSQKFCVILSYYFSSRLGRRPLQPVLSRIVDQTVRVTQPLMSGIMKSAQAEILFEHRAVCLSIVAVEADVVQIHDCAFLSVRRTRTAGQ